MTGPQLVALLVAIREISLLPAYEMDPKGAAALPPADGNLLARLGFIGALATAQISRQEGNVAFPLVSESMTARELALAQALANAHQALDLCMASIATLDRTFRPSESPMWPAIAQAAQILAALPVKRGR
jgi:hypothetical protein